MKKSEKPTLAQAGYILDTATELEINRKLFQTLHDDGTWTKVLRERRDSVLAKKGSVRAFELTATVRQDRDYIEALEAVVGPDCDGARHGHHWNPPGSGQEEEVEFILLNILDGEGCYYRAISWAKFNDYKHTNSRELFAVCEKHDLRKILDVDWLRLTETDRNHIYIRWSMFDSLTAHIDRNWRSNRFGGYHDWFLFRK